MRVIFVLLTCLTLAGCEQPGQQPATDSTGTSNKFTVIASNYPLYFFASQIAAGASAEIEIKLPEMEGDPANWKPDSNAIAELQNADLVVLNGAGYESWLGWITLPEHRLLDTSTGITEQLIPMESDSVHQHGPAGEHSHKNKAFTVWLNPVLAIEQARSIHGALLRLAPQHAELLATNFESLAGSLSRLDQEQEAVFSQLGDRAILFSHPVYQYLQERYQINGRSVHWEAGELPATRSWIELGEILTKHPAQLMLWEGAPLEETRSRLLDSGITSIPYHTASNRPESGDYLDLMDANMQRLRVLYGHER
jgi:zinc transport system substrate-binding protein